MMQTKAEAVQAYQTALLEMIVIGIMPDETTVTHMKDVKHRILHGFTEHIIEPERDMSNKEVPYEAVQELLDQNLGN